MITTDEVKKLAQRIWNYHLMHHTLKKVDCILVLGSHDTRIAERGAELYLQGWAPLLVFSGGFGNLTRGIWDEPEADKFAKIAESMGVPKEAILIENKSTNTGENILFTQKLLEEKGLHPQSFIVVQKPYMERRTYAIAKKYWSDKDIIVTSPQISFDNYPNSDISFDDVMNVMTGDLQRIKIYPAEGYQIAQEIPDDVWQAYERLVELGYTKYLVK